MTNTIKANIKKYAGYIVLISMTLFIYGVTPAEHVLYRANGHEVIETTVFGMTAKTTLIIGEDAPDHPRVMFTVNHSYEELVTGELNGKKASTFGVFVNGKLMSGLTKEERRFTMSEMNVLREASTIEVMAQNDKVATRMVEATGIEKAYSVWIESQQRL